ncbi:PadR family transcriptional regulator [Candidatus Marsarchaeota archaeon]|nr:PadR family transcriptional regulator [Candidatus Marsarchaeota archaeon]
MQKPWCMCGPFRIDLVPRGLLKPYVLSLLFERPMHGFEIMQEISERTNGAWRPGPAAIYPTLMMLEKGGYIERMHEKKQGERARLPFKITKKGEEVVLKHKKTIEEVSRNAGL